MLIDDFPASVISHSITMEAKKFYLIIIFFFFFFHFTSSQSHKCLKNEQSALLQFKAESSSSSSSKLSTWNPNTDCCSWKGITCDHATGHVIGLNLKNAELSGSIDSNSSLFKLRALQKLDLSGNFVSLSTHRSSTISDSTGTEIPHFFIPSGIKEFVNLTHINLADAGFSGQIPPELSLLTKLVSIDLSGNELKLEKPNLETIIRDMPDLQELKLDGVNMSSGNRDWAAALSLSVPSLRVLSLQGCSISGPLDISLSNLSYIDLSFNNLSTQVPESFGSLSSLISILLGNSTLQGEFPKSIFKLPKLNELDISSNPDLLGSFPDYFPKNSSIQLLSLSQTRFYGALPESIGNLEYLDYLSLDNCNFSGIIPNSISNLTRLLSLSLSSNLLCGRIPPLLLSKLLVLNLRNNSFTGFVHHSLFSLPSLKYLLLDQNHFHGLPSEVPNKISPRLTTLSIGNNKLQGRFPTLISKLKSLEFLDISSNNLTGIVKMEEFSKLTNLRFLALSDNSWSGFSSTELSLPYLEELYLCSCNINEFPGFLRNLSHLEYLGLSNNKIKDLSDNSWSGFSSTELSLPYLSWLDMHSCNINEFPGFLKNLSHLSYLDLSNNKIKDQVIPNWIWMRSLTFLNLSHNLLTGLERPLPDPSSLSLTYLDIHSNMIQGSILFLSEYALFLDYSQNNFSGIIPTDVSLYLSNATFFSVSGNKLVGEIPESICRSQYLQVLDLSDNAFSGSVPNCLGGFSNGLLVLNLGKNRLSGTMPGIYSGNLRSLVLNGNHMEGILPSALSDCKLLEVLDVGNNELNDTFPFWLGNLPKLQVLVLHSNMFHGPIRQQPRAMVEFPALHVIDISRNRFVGPLPSGYFRNFKSMKTEDEINNRINYLGVRHYHDSVTVTIKGQEVLMLRILTIFTSVDLSNNAFEGGIPGSICELKWLRLLNLSCNHLDKQIPFCLENLRQLESLDLSDNNLSGKIPQQLKSLTFLSVLNLARNKLEGPIPSGKQFDTFSNKSYEGNDRLCGSPLSRKCDSSGKGVGEEDTSGSVRMFDWRWIMMGYGSGMVAGLSIGYILFWRNHGWFADVIRTNRRFNRKGRRRWKKNRR